MLGLRDLAGGPGPGFSCKPVSSSQLKASARKLRVCVVGSSPPQRQTPAISESIWNFSGNETKAQLLGPSGFSLPFDEVHGLLLRHRQGLLNK